MAGERPSSSKRPPSPNATEQPLDKRIRTQQAPSWDLYRLWPVERTDEEQLVSDAFKEECAREGIERIKTPTVIQGSSRF